MDGVGDIADLVSYNVIPIGFGSRVVDFGQRGTGAQRGEIDGLHALGNDQVTQGCTLVEHIGADLDNAIAENELGQPAALIECQVTNFGDAVGND